MLCDEGSRLLDRLVQHLARYLGRSALGFCLEVLPCNFDVTEMADLGHVPLSPSISGTTAAPASDYDIEAACEKTIESEHFAASKNGLG